MNEKIHIMIVDDEPDVLEAFKMMLEDEGYMVCTAMNQQEALDRLEEYPISICLVDFKLGKENGLEVGRALHDKDSLIKTIIITAYPAYETAVDAIKMGIFDYVGKTVDPRELLEKIEAALLYRSKEIAAKAPQAVNAHKNLVMVCKHVLNQGGIENFCNHNPEFRLMHVYPSCAYIKSNDFNAETHLLLLCLSCCQYDKSDDPQAMFARLATFFPNAGLVVINSDVDDDQKISMVKWGVKGVLPANISRNNMRRAFDMILDGQLWVSRGVTHKLLSQLLSNVTAAGYKKPANWYNLSRREVEILQGMAGGLSNHELSEKYFISENTVKIHITHIFKKLKVKSRTQAVMKAREAQVI